jgi:hypothetical protein
LRWKEVPLMTTVYHQQPIDKNPPTTEQQIDRLEAAIAAHDATLAALHAEACDPARHERHWAELRAAAEAIFAPKGGA